MNTLFPLVFSSSLMEDLAKCPLFAFRKHCQKYREPPNIHLRAGGAMAKALEISRKAFFNEKTTEENAIAAGIQYLESLEEIESETKNIPSLIAAFTRYYRKFPLSCDKTAPILLADGTYAAEYEFSFDLGILHPEIPDRNILFNGRIDLAVERLMPNGEREIFVLDEKTTSRVKRVQGSREIDVAKESQQYALRGQFIAYTWALKQIMLNAGVELKTAGAIIRRIPLTKEIEQPYEILIPISPMMVDNWATGMRLRIEQFLWNYMEWKKSSRDFREFFIPNYAASCESYNSLCTYAVGCTSSRGEEQLKMTHPQLVGYPEIPVEDGVMTLEVYLKTLENKA